MISDVVIDVSNPPKKPKKCERKVEISEQQPVHLNEMILSSVRMLVEQPIFARTSAV